MLSRQRYDYSFWKNDYHDFTCKKKQAQGTKYMSNASKGTYGVP